MQDLIKDIEDGVCSQDIYYLKGYDKDNNELHFIRYFEQTIVLKIWILYIMMDCLAVCILKILILLIINFLIFVQMLKLSQ